MPGDERRRPDTRFLFAHPAHFIALGAGAGLAPVGPGTAGTLWAWVAWVALQRWLPPGHPVAERLGIGAAAAGALALLAAVLVAGWAATVTARHLQSGDPGAIVADEIVAFWLVLWLAMPMGFAGQLVAFLLFRFFDAAKPQPVRWADRRFKDAGGWRGGFGIVFDDLVAAFCTLLVIAAWRAATR